jgi:hypothetical protein
MSHFFWINRGRHVSLPLETMINKGISTEVSELLVSVNFCLSSQEIVSIVVVSENLVAARYTTLIQYMTKLTSISKHNMMFMRRHLE